MRRIKPDILLKVLVPLLLINNPIRRRRTGFNGFPHMVFYLFLLCSVFGDYYVNHRLSLFTIIVTITQHWKLYLLLT